MTNKQTAPPAMYDHCNRVYQALLQEAKAITVQEEGTERSIILWEGMFTNFITSNMNLSTPYFTSIRRELIRMGCIRQLRRGGGISSSQWELLREPTLELFMHERPKRAVSPAQTKFAGIQDQLNALQNRVALLERALEGILTEEGI